MLIDHVVCLFSFLEGKVSTCGFWNEVTLKEDAAKPLPLFLCVIA